jgi:hypothetical protein
VANENCDARCDDQELLLRGWPLLRKCSRQQNGN